MRQEIGRLLRKGRDALGRRGIWIRTVRGSEQWRAGVEILWHDIDRAQERVTIATVAHGDQKMRFLVRNKDDWIQSHHLRGSLYAESELDLIRKVYRGGTFVDVGANVGNHSIAAACLFGAAKVIAFEPNPEAYRILRCNSALNDVAEIVTHLPVGLSDHVAKATAQSPDHGMNLGGTKLVEGVGDLSLQIGDDLLGEEAIGFIKIDVEGGEMPVLRGLRQTIARHRPPMLVEVDDDNVGAFDAWCQGQRYRIAERMRPYIGNENFLILPLD